MVICERPSTLSSCNASKSVVSINYFTRDSSFFTSMKHGSITTQHDGASHGTRQKSISGGSQRALRLAEGRQEGSDRKKWSRNRNWHRELKHGHCVGSAGDLPGEMSRKIDGHYKAISVPIFKNWPAKVLDWVTAKYSFKGAPSASARYVSLS